MEADALIAQGLEFMEAGQNHEALQRFTSATKADPANGQAFYCLGCVLAELNRHEEAVNAFGSAAKLAPDHATLALFNMGNSLQELKQFDKAIEIFRMVTELDATDADAWTNLGRLLDEQGKHDEALRCYDRALEHAPDDVTTLTNRGNSLWALGQLQQAIDSYSKALVIDPHDPTATAAKAACEARLKEQL